MNTRRRQNMTDCYKSQLRPTKEAPGWSTIHARKAPSPRSRKCIRSDTIQMGVIDLWELSVHLYVTGSSQPLPLYSGNAEGYPRQRRRPGASIHASPTCEQVGGSDGRLGHWRHSLVGACRTAGRTWSCLHLLGFSRQQRDDWSRASHQQRTARRRIIDESSMTVRINLVVETLSGLQPYLFLSVTVALRFQSPGIGRL